MAKHFDHTITDTSLAVQRRHDQIAAEAALDGIYVLRTTVDRRPTSTPPGSSTATRTWPTSNATSASSRPTTWTCAPSTTASTERVKAHVLICLLACYLIWHLRKAWAPMTFTDEHPPGRDNPVAPAQRSAAADAKASSQPRRRRQPTAQLPRPARPPGHPHPQPDPLHRHQHRRSPCSPTPPTTSAAPSTLIGAPIPLTAA